MLPSEFKIRLGEEKDIEESVELGVAFHQEANLDFYSPVDPESFGRFLKWVIDSNHIFLVTEFESHIVGLCVGLVVPVYFNDSELVSQELVFYVDQSYRDKGIGKYLIDAFETESINRGAKTLCVGAKSNMRVEAMGKMYSRRGYQELERYFVRRI